MNVKLKFGLITLSIIIFQSFLKLIGVILTNSLSFLSETVDTIVDIGFISLTLYFLYQSEKPADFDHMYGHSKIDSIGALIQGIILIIVYILLIFNAIQTLLEGVIIKPHGIIFVTGPTGSGKTTTLYACLSKINSTEIKIVTVEDPIEYQLKGVNQMQVQPKIGLSFATGLRHILRHDPDVMMIGEVRDYETAEIAIRAALTGHLIFSTLHTNDACGTVTRLLDMGVEPFLVSSSLECLIAQRLVRLICPDCKVAARSNKEILEHLEGIEIDATKIQLHEGKGCKHCRSTGYRGRTAIYEVLPMNESIRQMVLSRASSQEIKKQALSMGMRTLRQDGIKKVLGVLTTISEVIRVTER